MLDLPVCGFRTFAAGVTSVHGMAQAGRVTLGRLLPDLIPPQSDSSPTPVRPQWGLAHSVTSVTYFCKGLHPAEGRPGHAPPETLATCVNGQSETRVAAALTWLRGCGQTLARLVLGRLHQAEVGRQGGAPRGQRGQKSWPGAARGPAGELCSSVADSMTRPQASALNQGNRAKTGMGPREELSDRRETQPGMGPWRQSVEAQGETESSRFLRTLLVSWKLEGFF